jgi:Cu/Ag efflux protein CusF
MAVRSRIIVLALAAVAALGAGCSREPASTAAKPAAQPARPTTQPARPTTPPLVFNGKVESVDVTNKVVTVAGENVDGWMGAMTMPYSVDPPGVLATLKPGDQIRATVYAGTLSTLYDVKVVPPAK